MNTLYTLMFIVAYGYGGSPSSDHIPNLTYGDCAQMIVKIRNNDNNANVLFADCVPQSELKHD